MPVARVTERWMTGSPLSLDHMEEVAAPVYKDAKCCHEKDSLHHKCISECTCQPGPAPDQRWNGPHGRRGMLGDEEENLTPRLQKSRMDLVEG